MTDEEPRTHIICQGHEELRDIALGTRNDVKHLTETVQRFITQLEGLELRVWTLEMNGAKISQDNAAGLKELCKRVDEIETFVSGHAAASREASKIAAIIAGGISITSTIISIAVSLYFWGKP